MSSRLLIGHVLDRLGELEPESVNCCVTSPPYLWKRKYPGSEVDWPDGWRGAFGWEPSVEMYVEHTLVVLRAIRRVLTRHGSVFWNIGDTRGKSGGAGGDYDEGGLREGQPRYRAPKNGTCFDRQWLGIPHRVALAAQADGWRWEDEIVWWKPGPMPESCANRTTRCHDYIMVFNLSKKAYYDADVVREPHSRDWTNTGGSLFNAPRHAEDSFVKGAAGEHRGDGPPRMNPAGRNLRSVWRFPSKPFTGWTQKTRQARVERDAVSCGMTHIVSGDCPAHGDLLGPAATDRGDPHEVGDSSRRERTDGDPAQEPEGDSGSIGLLPAEGIAVDNSGCSRPACEPSARPRSSGTHRTGRAPSTSQPYMPFDGRQSGSSDIPGSPSTHEPSSRRRGNSISADAAVGGMVSGPSARTLCRIVDSSTLPIPPECSCQFYQEIAEKSSHFATFPPELPRRCILAGCPPKVCAACGEPWVRIVERGQLMPDAPGYKPRGKPGPPLVKRAMTPAGSKQGHPNFHYEKADLGWRPTCSCGPEAGTRLAVVLDPFAGSGTTLAVAESLGRDGVGIELAAEYEPLIRERLVQPSLAREMR